MVILHPGFLKSATTTLQRGVFEELPQLSLLEANELDSGLRRIQGVDYDADRARQIDDRCLASAPVSGKAVLSDESLTANPYLLQPIAERLKALFPHARLFFTIRHQFDAVFSFYTRHGRVLYNAPEPYHNRHVSFENWLEHVYRGWPASKLGAFDYHSAISVYECVFGRNRIDVLLFKELREDPRGFARHLAAVRQVDAGRVATLLEGEHQHGRESRRTVLYDRFRKRFLRGGWTRTLLPYTELARRHLRRFLEQGKAPSVELPGGWRERLSKLYGSGNRALSDRYGLELERYQYP